VLAPNTTDIFELQFACGRLGAILLPLNWRLTVHELAVILDDAKPKLLLHDRAFENQAFALKANTGLPALLELDCEMPDNAYERTLAAAPPTFTSASLTHADAITVLYTSGTTGRPKGVVVTHGMTFWNCVNLGMATRVSSDSVSLTVVPLFHTAGLNHFANPCFHAGGAVVVARAFEPGQVLDLVSDPAIGITHFWGVPAHYNFMLQHERFTAADFSRLVTACVGGAPVALSLLEAYAKKAWRCSRVTE
jgi:fatty-acyl-CoA synthase